MIDDDPNSDATRARDRERLDVPVEHVDVGLLAARGVGLDLFAGPREFKALLLRETPFIARNLAAKLVTFGTGHHTEPGDVLELDRVVAEAGKNDLGLRSLVVAVVQSELFRNK